MSCNWSDYEGRFAGEWRLQSFLGERDRKAFFSAASKDGKPALVELVEAGDAEAEAAAGSWAKAGSLDHPNILKVFASGKADLDACPAYYAALELPDDDLSELLGRRTITPAEARPTFLAVAKALEYLHGLGLRHGAVLPSNILQVGDKVRLSVDTVAPAGDDGEDRDIAEFGSTLVQALAGADAAGSLEQPFRDIALRSLDPARRWRAGVIVRALSGKSVEDVQPARRPARVVEPVEKERPAGALIQKRYLWPAAAGVLFGVVILATFIFAGKSKKDPVAVQQPQAAAAPAVPAAQPPAGPARPAVRETRSAPPPITLPTVKPAPAKVAETPRRGSAARSTQSWAVIAATYGSYEAADKRASTIRKRSRLRARVFPPAGSGRRYFVVLGSGMTQDEAERLRRTAVRSGAPRDTYVTKLNEG